MKTDARNITTDPSEAFVGDVEQQRRADHGRAVFSAGSSRLVSLDVFRGITIAAMILVNDPGSWQHIYPPLDHAEWNGWTHTDLIFPFFMFIVGVSMAFSFTSRRAKGKTRGELARHTLRRGILIYGIGFFLAMFPFFDLQHLRHIRIMGVLARIGVCYIFAGWIYLYAGKVGRALAIVASLAGYWAMMMFIPVPGFGAGNLTPDGNLAAYIDRAVMLGHLWRPTWDPEGLLSSIPAIATMLIGTFVGELLMSKRTWQSKVKWLLAAGAAGLLAGEALHPYFPINKNLWTSSFVIFTAGYAMVALAACYWVVDVKRWRAWSTPFLVLGMNAILSFSLATFIAKNLLIYKMRMPDGRVVSAWTWIYHRWFETLFVGTRFVGTRFAGKALAGTAFADPRNGSLAFAVAFVLMVTAIMWWFYRRKIFLRV